MISIDKKQLTISGNPVEIANQFVEIAKGVRGCLAQAFSSSIANASVDAFYELSKISEEDIKNKSVEEIMKAVLKDFAEKEWKYE